MACKKKLNDVTPAEWDAAQKALVREELLEAQAALETQVGGNHYKHMRIQPIEFAMVNGLDTCQSNVLKYICRHKEKGGKVDLLKAKHYIDIMMEHYYANN